MKTTTIRAVLLSVVALLAAVLAAVVAALLIRGDSPAVAGRWPAPGRGG